MRPLIFSLILLNAPAWAQGAANAADARSARYWNSVGRCDLDILRIGTEVLRASSKKGRPGLPDAQKMGALDADFQKDFRAFELVHPGEAAFKGLNRRLTVSFGAVKTGVHAMARALQARDQGRYQYLLFRVGAAVRDANAVVNQMQAVEKRLHGKAFAAAERSYAARAGMFAREASKKGAVQ